MNKHFAVLTVFIIFLCAAFLGAQTVYKTLILDDDGVIVAPADFWDQNPPPTSSITNSLSTWTGSTNIITLGNVSAGTWNGDTIALNKGGTSATTASGARTNLGLTIGTDVLAPNGNGSALTGLTWSQIGSTPTTLAGYGIAGAQTISSSGAHMSLTLAGPSFYDARLILSADGGTYSWLMAASSIAGELQIGSNLGGSGVVSISGNLTVSGSVSGSGLSGTNTGDQTASTVTSSASGNIASTNVQAALEELDDEKQAVEAVETFSNADKTVTAGTNLLKQTGTMSAVRTVTLPSAATVDDNEPLVIMDVSGSVSQSNYINIVRSGSDTINGVSSTAIQVPYGSLILRRVGSTAWVTTMPLMATNVGLTLLSLNNTTDIVWPYAEAVRDSGNGITIFTGADGEASFNNFSILTFLGNTKTAFQNELSEVIAASSPTSCSTVTLGASQQNITCYLTPAGTLAALTLTLPAESDSRNGQIVRLFSTQQLTSLTVNVSGSGTLQGSTLSTLSANTGAAWQRVSDSGNGTWVRLY